MDQRLGCSKLQAKSQRCLPLLVTKTVTGPPPGASYFFSLFTKLHLMTFDRLQGGIGATRKTSPVVAFARCLGGTNDPSISFAS